MCVFLLSVGETHLLLSLFSKVPSKVDPIPSPDLPWFNPHNVVKWEEVHP